LGIAAGKPFGFKLADIKERESVLHLAKARLHTPELLTELLQLRVEEPCLPGGGRWCSPILDSYPVGDIPYEGV
jgi:hypothetical protein